MGYAETLKKIKESDAKASAEIEAILSMEISSFTQVYPHVRGYILSRFLLDDDTKTDNLKELVSGSISKSLEISEYDLDVTDLSDRCISAPSVETKLVILIMKLEEALGIKLDIMERVNAETVSDLTEAIVKHLNDRLQSA